MAIRRYWLVKSEPDVYSIEDLARDRSTSWEGVRNYQARNLMREMKVGDGVLFYHSSTQPMAVVGVARVGREAYADPTQFDRKSHYHDPGANRDDPRWLMVDVEFVAKLKTPQTLAELKTVPELAGMALLKRGQRLSVQPVSADEWRLICQRGGVKG